MKIAPNRNAGSRPCSAFLRTKERGFQRPDLTESRGRVVPSVFLLIFTTDDDGKGQDPKGRWGKEAAVL